ncbi:hypothetical protein H6G27_23065 [Nostoc linckia FACHB-104]|nr:hypothetical protein [Nostoc linckia FACHB-104]
MTNRLPTQMKNIRTEVSTSANSGNLGMFQPHRFVTETYSVTQAQHKDQKTSLMRAARYGHSLSQRNFDNKSALQAIQPKLETGQPTEVIQCFKLDGKKHPGASLKQAGETQDQFRLRMKAQMDTLRQTMEGKDKGTILPEPTDLMQEPPNFSKRMKNERQGELDNLNKGKLTGGQIVESAGLAPGVYGPRNQTITNTSQSSPSVTAGSTQTTTTTSFLPAGKKVKTLAGGNAGGLEHKLNNPLSTKDRPRQGMLDRQKEIMRVSELANPFMQTLDAGGDLSATHTLAKNFKGNKGKLKPGFALNKAGVLEDATAQPVHAIGAKEFGNRPTHGKAAWAKNPGDAVESLLPALNTTNQIGAEANDATHSRLNRWSEADVTPVTGHTKTNKLDPRNADRLLHTSVNSQALNPSTGQHQKVDHRFYVTSDHYYSAVPVAPVQKDYMNNLKKTKKFKPSLYMDPTGNLNSLHYHQHKLNRLKTLYMQGVI